jgi:hypothetical protein
MVILEKRYPGHGKHGWHVSEHLVPAVTWRRGRSRLSARICLDEFTGLGMIGKRKCLSRPLCAQHPGTCRRQAAVIGQRQQEPKVGLTCAIALRFISRDSGSLTSGRSSLKGLSLRRRRSTSCGESMTEVSPIEGRSRSAQFLGWRRVPLPGRVEERFRCQDGLAPHMRAPIA